MRGQLVLPKNLNPENVKSLTIYAQKYEKTLNLRIFDRTRILNNFHM